VPKCVDVGRSPLQEGGQWQRGHGLGKSSGKSSDKPFLWRVEWKIPLNSVDVPWFPKMVVPQKG